MTALVGPIGGGSTGGVASAVNQRGTTSGLAPLATATLVSFVAGTTKLRGFTVFGDTDAEVWVEVDGAPLAGIRARHSRVLPAYIVLPNPENYSSPTAVVALRVQNTGATAGDFQGTLLGE
jgi:hypothetical protein